MHTSRIVSPRVQMTTRSGCKLQWWLTSNPSFDFLSAGFSVPTLLIRPCKGRFRALKSAAQSAMSLSRGTIIIQSLTHACKNQWFKSLVQLVEHLTRMHALYAIPKAIQVVCMQPLHLCSRVISFDLLDSPVYIAPRDDQYATKSPHDLPVHPDTSWQVHTHAPTLFFGISGSHKNLRIFSCQGFDDLKTKSCVAARDDENFATLIWNLIQIDRSL